MELQELIEIIKNAKEKLNENCIDGKEHDLNFIFHSDGKDSFSNYYRCAKCKEVIVQKVKRKGLNKSLWNQNVN